MKKRTMAERRSACPLNATLEVLGDRWSLLIVRDLIFKGRTTYKDFLAGGEGIATNVLADRLRRLEAEGVIGKGRDAADARRLVYRLTAKGLALAPVLVEMIVWGAGRSEEHTSELQSRLHLVCRLLLEKKKNNKTIEYKHIMYS